MRCGRRARTRARTSPTPGEQRQRPDDDQDEKRWLFAEPINWDDVMLRWRRRGPANEQLIGDVQRGFKHMQTLLNGNGR